VGAAAEVEDDRVGRASLDDRAFHWSASLNSTPTSSANPTTVKFNAAALVRTDLLTRYQAHESAIRAGWKLRSEVRELEDLPPITGINDQDPSPEGAIA
jgi:phage portal protein BeeE